MSQLTDKQLKNAGFKEGLKGFWIDVGNSDDGKKIMTVELEKEVTIKKRVKKGFGIANEEICTYSVKDRGPITSWLLNTLYYIFSGKNLGLTE